MSSLDELLYKEKYLKYKNKYIQLKEYQVGGLFNKTRKAAAKAKTDAIAAATKAKTVAATVATKASDAKTGATKILFPTAYIFAKTSDIKSFSDKLQNNISDIKIQLNKKGYIIKSNDPLQMIMIGSKSDLSKKFSNAVNSTNDFVYGNKTFEGQIKKISNCTQTNIKDINLILNNNHAILNNNSVLTNIKNIKSNEMQNIDYINNINETLFKNKNENKKLSRNVGTSHSNDIIKLDNNLFNIVHNDIIINNIKKLVYDELVKTDKQMKQVSDETEKIKEISYMYIKYNNVYNSEADIIFSIPQQPETDNGRAS
jgi:hypothetical protein